ncbi:hypothetical protein, partial [Salinisphaera sp. T5B8]|uniref:hypothetical protein n=1 Tax=Salinisphaera sp. T5B8 TaxID=1304154 RepID=UPI00334071C4
PALGSRIYRKGVAYSIDAMRHRMRTQAGRDRTDIRDHQNRRDHQQSGCLLVAKQLPQLDHES